MKPDFIGRTGSREYVISKLNCFLSEPASGYCRVIGTWKVGKSRVIEEALNKDKDGKVSRFFEFQSKGYIELGVEEMRELITGTRLKPRKSRFKVVEELNRAIEERVRPGETVIFRLSINSLKDDHCVLAGLCNPSQLSGLPRIAWSRRKFILETYTELEPNWLDEGILRESVRVIKYDEKEAGDFLTSRLGTLLRLKTPEQEASLTTVACKNVGYHPELLRRLCDQLESYGRNFIDERLGDLKEFERSLEKLIYDCFDGASREPWEKSVRSILLSLSASARATIEQQSHEFHIEVYGAGLIVDKKLVWVVRKFALPSPPNSADISSREFDRNYGQQETVENLKPIVAPLVTANEAIEGFLTAAWKEIFPSSIGGDRLAKREPDYKDALSTLRSIQESYLPPWMADEIAGADSMWKKQELFDKILATLLKLRRGIV